MRTTPEECAAMAKDLAEKINAYTGPVSVLLPTKAISVISAEGQSFYDPVADQALFSAMKESLRDDIPVIELDCGINDPEFAKACANTLLQHMSSST